MSNRLTLLFCAFPLVLSASAFGQNTNEANPSFSCSGDLQPAEAVICSDDSLASLDRQLAAVYDSALTNLPAGQRTQIEAAESAWVAERNRCRTDKPCIRNAYRARIGSLGGYASQISPLAVAQNPPRIPEPPTARQMPYIVDGLALGGQVRFGTEAYNQYHCKPSEYPNLTWCHKEKRESTKHGIATSANSILHTQDGTAVYVNRYIEPAFFGPNEVRTEIDRLSAKFGERAHEFRMPHRDGLPNAVIAVWGAVELKQVDSADASAVASGASLSKGMLVSFLGDIQRSARDGVPVYRLAGGAGYVWAATFSQDGRGVLRFLTIDPSQIVPPSIAPASLSPPSSVQEWERPSGYASQASPPTATENPPALPRTAVAQTSTQQEAPTTDCDTYAASDHDPQRKTAGLPFDKVNPALAVPACERAVQKYPNSSRLAYQLGRAYQAVKNFDAALSQYHKAADQGYALAQASIGSMYAGGRGVPQDYSEAVAWYRKAADQGVAFGQFQLGAMYFEGHGVPLDYSQAYAWYRKAADQGLALAQNNLGVMYERGLGVPQDSARAIELYRKAAAQGVETAQANLRRLSPETAAPQASAASTPADHGREWLQAYFAAHGGCSGNYGFLFDSQIMPAMSNVQYAVNGLKDIEKVALFDMPVLKWSDDDVETALRFYRDCQEKGHAATIFRCMSGGHDRVRCEQGNPHIGDDIYRRVERQLREVIITARNVVAERKAQQQAKIDLEKLKAAQEEKEKQAAAAQAEKERQAVEGKRRAEEEQRKAEEEKQREIEAIKKREEDEKRAAKEKHEAEVRAAERKREVESMPLTATDVQLAVNTVEKFVADYSARKIDASNADARLEEATRAADEASRLIQRVKDHMTPDDDPTTLNLENKIVGVRPHLDELHAKIVGIPQEIAQEKAEKEKADRLRQEAEEEEADRQRDKKEVGERHLAVNTMFDNVLVILNDGEVTVRISDIQIDGRRECTESATQDHAAWFNAANKLDDSEKVHPIKLKVGESRRWLSPCRVIFSDITTYQGTMRYKSE
jgi:TPR repeat protein